MNSKLALTVIVMFAVIMGLGISPAMAAPNDHANDKAKVGKGPDLSLARASTPAR